MYPDILKNPDSTEKQYFGFTYKTWYGFLKYNPMDDYINIDIPILVQQGLTDTNSPVESARAIESEFKKAGKTNLTYMEYGDMSHRPENDAQNDRLLDDIKNWLE